MKVEFHLVALLFKTITVITLEQACLIFLLIYILY